MENIDEEFVTTWAAGLVVVPKYHGPAGFHSILVAHDDIAVKLTVDFDDSKRGAGPVEGVGALGVRQRLPGGVNVSVVHLKLPAVLEDVTYKDRVTDKRIGLRHEDGTKLLCGVARQGDILTRLNKALVYKELPAVSNLDWRLGAGDRGAEQAGGDQFQAEGRTCTPQDSLVTNHTHVPGIIWRPPHKFEHCGNRSETIPT